MIAAVNNKREFPISSLFDLVKKKVIPVTAIALAILPMVRADFEGDMRRFKNIAPLAAVNGTSEPGSADLPTWANVTIFCGIALFVALGIKFGNPRLGDPRP